MASKNPPRNYDEQTLLAIEQALRDVWQVAHDPYKDWNKDPELKRALAETLMALADTGVVDPEELRSRALESFEFRPTH